MAGVTPSSDRASPLQADLLQADLLQASLLKLQARRLALISLIMSRRVDEDSPSPPGAAPSMLGHRLAILIAYVRLRRAIAACESFRRSR